MDTGQKFIVWVGWAVASVVCWVFYYVLKTTKTDGDSIPYLRLLLFWFGVIFLVASAVSLYSWWQWDRINRKERADDNAAKTTLSRESSAMAEFGRSLDGVPGADKARLVEEMLQRGKRDESDLCLPCGVACDWALAYIHKSAAVYGQELSNGMPLIPQHRYPDGAERERVRTFHEWGIENRMISRSEGNQPPTVLDADMLRSWIV